MIHPYDKIYLSDAMENFGEMFQYVINDCEYDPDDFFDKFIRSGFAREFENGSPRVISGMSGAEIGISVFRLYGNDNPIESSIYFIPQSEYWAGWILAYFQWETGIPFKEIHKYVKIGDILNLYYPLHEAHESKAVEAISQIYNSRKTITNLQAQRKLQGLSQKELSQRAMVNLRTLQQYETGAKKINNAAVSQVMNLAKVLHCQIDDILEYEVL